VGDDGGSQRQPRADRDRPRSIRNETTTFANVTVANDSGAPTAAVTSPAAARR